MIDIVFATNEFYRKHMMVAMKSILENSECAINFHIITSDLTSGQKNLILDIFKCEKCQINFYEFEYDRDNLIVYDYLTPEAYYRIFIEDILPPYINKVIYLDCDLIVLQDIKELWENDIDDFYIGAIEARDYSDKKRIGLNEKDSYFNSGVLIMNLKKWRSNSPRNKILSLMNQYKNVLYSCDQDAMNLCFLNNWKKVNQKWNVRTSFFEKSATNHKLTQMEFEKLLSSPGIVHFTTHIKPWMFLSTHPYKPVYEKYYEMVGFEKLDHYNLVNYLNSKNIYLFGAGSKGEYIADKLEECRVEIKGFIDNDRSRIGESFKNKIIHSIENIIKEKNNLIIITSSFEKEIEKQIKNLSMQKNVDYLTYLDLLNYRVTQ